MKEFRIAILADTTFSDYSLLSRVLIAMADVEAADCKMVLVHHGQYSPLALMVMFTACHDVQLKQDSPFIFGTTDHVLVFSQRGALHTEANLKLVDEGTTVVQY